MFIFSVSLFYSEYNSYACFETIVFYIVDIYCESNMSFDTI